MPKLKKKVDYANIIEKIYDIYEISDKLTQNDINRNTIQQLSILIEKYVKDIKDGTIKKKDNLNIIDESQVTNKQLLDKMISIENEIMSLKNIVELFTNKK